MLRLRWEKAARSAQCDLVPYFGQNLEFHYAKVSPGGAGLNKLDERKL
jgi:hypothetical protein